MKKLWSSWVSLVICALALRAQQPPNTVLDLQPFRQSSSIQIKLKGARPATATLINLNPEVNVWYLLTIDAAGGDSQTSYHLENPKPEIQRLVLNERTSGIVIIAGGNRYSCDLFNGDQLVQGKVSPLIYVPLCDGRVYLRNPVVGHRSNLEAATEFLRDHVWGGEKIITVGHALMGEVHREAGKIEPNPETASIPRLANGAPLDALIDQKYCNRLLMSANLGIAFDNRGKTGMIPGAWYEAKENPGVYVSILQPNLIDPAILQSYRTNVNSLETVEASALCYLIAFDLDRFDLGYALGTEHPKVDWSEHIPAQMRNPGWPGPDGIGTIAPLVSTGLINPEAAQRTIATFTGGFKRFHGAFKYGELSLKNHASHYGFVENGVVFSKLQPGLATVFVLNDGSVDLKTWAEADNKLLARIKYARQNGVALVEPDPITQSPAPGRLVGRWGPGNWSGSEDKKLLTMRSGIALQRSKGKRYLLYAVFSDATPSAMARIFQSYRCDYAMLLDMNALEHTYCALYRRSGSRLSVGHLIKGMSQLDKSGPSGEPLPRFLSFPDNRDFFYLMRRNGQEAKP